MTTDQPCTGPDMLLIPVSEHLKTATPAVVSYAVFNNMNILRCF